MKNSIKRKYMIIVSFAILFIFTTCILLLESEETVTTSGKEVSTKKIEWGIKRNDNHEQPDLGSVNRKILEEAKGIAIGNENSKKVYLTFDEGYEAGYTERILEVLKQNNVSATFFITAHYVNTQPDLVQRMINEGHTIGNHF